LPKVMGVASSAVGPADIASGVKSENRTLAAPATSAMATAPVSSRPPTANALFFLRE